MNVMKPILAVGLCIASLVFASCDSSHGETREMLPYETEFAETALVETVLAETDAAEDPFSAVRESDELWLSYGLAAYEEGREAPDLSAFFADRANMTWLTLYDHLFTYDGEKSIPAAEALFRFITDNYGTDALLDLERRVELKSAYLRSLGLDTDYLQSPEVEAFFNTMTFSSDDTYKYIMTFGKAVYCFEDFTEGPPALYHGFLYYNTAGLEKMIDYLRENGLDTGLDTERTFEFIMTLDVTEPSVTDYETGRMTVNDSHSALHEAVHAMGVNKTEHLWLTEGIAGYLGYLKGFQPQLASSVRQILMKVPQGGYEGRHDAVKEYAERVYGRYTEGGGSVDSPDAVDVRLYYDVQARTDFEGNYNPTLGEIRDHINGAGTAGDGSELTYNQANSFTAYLADTYGMGTVMEAYRTGDIKGTFGKDYGELKGAWMESIGAAEAE